METCYSENKSELGEICKTEFGPKTDGKRKRRNKFSETRNSFNDAFCKDYFNANSVRESYFYYVELLFANLDEKILEKTFELRCCQDGHNLKCLEK